MEADCRALAHDDPGAHASFVLYMKSGHTTGIQASNLAEAQLTARSLHA